VLIGALLTAIQANSFFLDGLLEAYAIIMTVFCLDRLSDFERGICFKVKVYPIIHPVDVQYQHLRIEMPILSGLLFVLIG